MVWFNVDDGLTTSPKVLSIPRSERLAVMGLWVMAGSWCGQHLTDGKVPAFMLEEWGADVSHGTRLVEVGLWRETVGGYRFHDWAAYQQSRADVEAKRERDRQRKQAYREKLAGQSANPEGTRPSGTTAGQDAGQDAESSTPNQALPSPTKPTLLSDGAANRGTRIPDPFLLTAEMKQWAGARAPLVNVERSTEKFVNYWRAKAGRDATKKDWRRTWNNWLLSDQEKAERNAPRGSAFDQAVNVVHLYREGEEHEEVGNCPAIGSGSGS